MASVALKEFLTTTVLYVKLHIVIAEITHDNLIL